MKRSYCLLTLLCSIFIGSLITVGVSSALEYQTNPSSGDNPVTLKFEFGSTLNITTGGNISISDLTPGTKAISASNYNVTVSTNNLTGYTLSATVGCSSGTDCYDSKNLSDGTNTFSMLSTDGALTAGTWGVSLDSSATANSNFKTLAKYDETATIINKTTSNTGTAATGYTGTANTTVRVGAYATTSQVAGTYTNSINFIAVANMIPEYMQDMTSSRLAELLPNDGDVVTLYDKRDGTAYTIGKLADDNYWMLDNLAIDLVSVPLSTLKGNTNATDTSLEYLKGVQTRDPNNDPDGNYATAGVADWANSSYYSAPHAFVGDKDLVSSSVIPGSKGQNKIGGHFNYCAASAGSYCYDGGSNTSVGDATEDICPSGWRMPTGASAGEYSTIAASVTGVASVSYNGDDATAIKQALSLPLSGYASDTGVNYANNNGYFWSSTWAMNNMFLYYIDTSNVYVMNATRNMMISVRCIYNI